MLHIFLLGSMALAILFLSARTAEAQMQDVNAPPGVKSENSPNAHSSLYAPFVTMTKDPDPAAPPIAQSTPMPADTPPAVYPEDFSSAPSRTLEKRYAAFGHDSAEESLHAQRPPQTPPGFR